MMSDDEKEVLKSGGFDVDPPPESTPIPGESELARGMTRELWESALPELRRRASEKTMLQVKCGFDPTIRDPHLGHFVLINKLRQFQEAGFFVRLVIGDFTARIGDPTGRSAERPKLSHGEAEANAKPFLDKITEFLDDRLTAFSYNSWWFEEMDLPEFMGILEKFTTQQMLARRDFRKRMDDGASLGLHELMYPIMQAHDSVVLEPDIELGGRDQLFNLSVGRDLMETCGKKPQIILTVDLLLGLDGKRKMSKSLDNHIPLSDPPYNIGSRDGMFGKIMSISDETMDQWYELLWAGDDCERQAAAQRGRKAEKVALAFDIVSSIHGEEAAEEARNQFDMLHPPKGQERVAPDLEPVTVSWSEVPQFPVAHLLKHLGMCSSVSDARRMIEGRGVKVDGHRILDKFSELRGGRSYLLQVGKRKFRRAELVYDSDSG